MKIKSPKAADTSDRPNPMPKGSKPEPHLKRNVRLVPWSKSWSEKFVTEKERWQRMLGPVCIDVQHIGSTAIKGIVAKPIIDVMVIVSSHAEVDRLMSQIVANGYQAKGAHGIPGRRYFQRDECGERAFHIHAYEQGHPEITTHLRFRDILRSNPAAARAYARYKIELAERFRTNKAAYTEAKHPFIEQILASHEESGSPESAASDPSR